MRLSLVLSALAASGAAAQTDSPSTASGIIYSTPSSSGNSTGSGAAAYPTPSTELAPSNLTGSVPSDFAPPTLVQDNGTYGPTIEIVHYYYGNWPIGLAVVPDQSLVLACYTRGTYNYTLGRAVNITTEEPYPSQDVQLSVDQLQDQIISNATGYQFASNTTDQLNSVQALYQSPDGAVWVIDTGRPTVTTSDGSSTMAYAQVGGPKLIRLSSNGSFERTYTFPGNVHYPDSYMNDVRFDMRANATSGGQGIAYIVDSSSEGRNGFIMLDLGTGKSWRRLTLHPSMLTVYQNRPSYFGQPWYQTTQGQAQNFNLEGFDGLAISPDGETAYYAPLTSDYLYSVPTSVLRADDSENNQAREQAASNAVQNLGQKGSQTNGFEADSNGIIYLSAPEQNAVYQYDPSTARFSTFVRDPRLFWVDSMVIADDGYLYGNVNQLPDQQMWQNGTELRSKPGFLFRAKLNNGGTRITNGLM